MQSIRPYSANQAFFGSFIGGPIASTWFIRQNYRYLGEPKNARLTVVVGVVLVAFIAGLIASGIADYLPRMVLPLAYSFATRLFVRAQMQPDESLSFAQIPEIPRAPIVYQSNWRVAGVSVATMALSIGGAFIVIIGLDYFNLLSR